MRRAAGFPVYRFRRAICGKRRRFPLEIPEPVLAILHRLEESGHEAFVAGGCVRDSLLGREPRDWDVCTSALPEETAACFPDARLLETGKRHGTITLLPDGGEPVEVTTYRTDGAYSDGRRPDSVAFVASLREDLARRDFTVNAMAFHPRRGLADPFGGERDLRSGVLRCVGDPERRFEEDALRILRGLRFASVYGFSLEKETEQALRRKREGLRRISPERIREELMGLLTGPHVESVLLAFPEVLEVFLPEITACVGFEQRSSHHSLDVWGHTARAVGSAVPEDTVRLTLLLHDLGKPLCFSADEDGTEYHFHGHGKVSARLAGDILTRLRFDRHTRERVLLLVERHDVPILPEPRLIKRWLCRIGEEALRQLFAVKRGDILAKATDTVAQSLIPLDEDEACLEEILAEKACFSTRDLAAGGRELLALGIPQGPQIGFLLTRLTELVIDGALPNEREPLLKEALRLLDEAPSHE